MAEEEKTSLRSDLLVHVEFIERYIKKNLNSKNSRNRDCSEKLRFILELIVSDQELCCNEIIEIDKTIKILKKHYAEHQLKKKNELTNKSNSNEAELITGSLEEKKRKLADSDDILTAKRTKKEHELEPCTSSPELNVLKDIERDGSDVPMIEITDVSEQLSPIKSDHKNFVVSCYNRIDNNKRYELEVKRNGFSEKQIPVNFVRKLTGTSTTTPPKMMLTQKRVCNISYRRYNNGLQFNCHLKQCKFGKVECYSSLMFEAHIEANHKTDIWNGSCLICQPIVFSPASIQSEYEHLRTVHLDIKNIPLKPFIKSTHKIKMMEEMRLIAKRKIEAVKQKIEARKRQIKEETESDTTRQTKKGIIISSSTNSFKKIKIATVRSLKDDPNIKFDDEDDDRTATLVDMSEIFKDEEKFENDDIVQIKGIKTEPSFEIPDEKSHEESSSNSSNLSSDKMFETTVLSLPIIKKTEAHIIQRKVESALTVMKTNFNSIARTVVITKSKSFSKDSLFKPNIHEMPRTSTNQIEKANDNVEIEENALRPWLEDDDFKLKHLYESMLQTKCLLNFYKCMHKTCAFHTNDKRIFSKHLSFHTDEQKCCYCMFVGNSQNLCTHIWDSHWMCKFACSLCFYRGIDRFLVYQHMLQHHNSPRNEPRNILYLKPYNKEDDNVDMIWVLEQRENLVKPIACTNFLSTTSECKAKIYDPEKFLKHQRLDHCLGKIITKYRCLPCNETIPLIQLQQHLIDVHKIKRFHCLWCPFDTQIINELKSHLCDQHPSQPPIYCDRAGCKSNKVCPTVINSTDIFKFTCTKYKSQFNLIIKRLSSTNV